MHLMFAPATCTSGLLEMPLQIQAAQAIILALFTAWSVPTAGLASVRYWSIAMEAMINADEYKLKVFKTASVLQPPTSMTKEFSSLRLSILIHPICETNQINCSRTS